MISNLWSYSLVLHKHRNDHTSIFCMCIQTIAHTLTSLPVQVLFENKCARNTGKRLLYAIINILDNTISSDIIDKTNIIPKLMILMQSFSVGLYTEETHK